jgi:hypothetical protein
LAGQSPKEVGTPIAAPPGEARLRFIILAALNRDQLIDLVKGRKWAGYDRGVDPGDAVAQEDGT